MLTALPSDTVKTGSPLSLTCELRGDQIIPIEVEISDSVSCIITNPIILTCTYLWLLLIHCLENLFGSSTSGICIIALINWFEQKSEEINQPVPWDDEKLCKVCIDNAANVVIIPCGHLCLCDECGFKMTSRKNSICPICRSIIANTQIVYFSWFRCNNSFHNHIPTYYFIKRISFLVCFCLKTLMLTIVRRLEQLW